MSAINSQMEYRDQRAAEGKESAGCVYLRKDGTCEGFRAWKVARDVL